MFLERNPSIQKFATEQQFLRAESIATMKANIKLDELAIKIRWTDDLVSFCHELNELHERGFYKRLQLYFGKLLRMKQGMIDSLATVNGLVKLNIYGLIDGPIALSALTSLEEIYVHFSYMIADPAAVANNCINLKRIYFHKSHMVNVMPFIGRSLNLEKIEMDFLYVGFQGDIYYDWRDNIIDLIALNGVRQQLPNAEKVTIYTQERIYLKTKEAMNETNFDLIQLKRKESFEWEHDF